MTRTVLLLALAAAWLAGSPMEAQEPPDGKRLLTATAGVRLDPRGSELEIALQPLPLDAKVFQAASFPSFLEAAQAGEKVGTPTLLSADAVRALFEEFDAGLLAGLHLLLGNGNGNEIQGKLWLLHTVLDRLLEKRAMLDEARRPVCDLAIVYIAGSLAAGGQAPQVPQDLEEKTTAAGKAAAPADPVAGPHGFWKRKPELPHLWRLDRAVARGLPLDGDQGFLAAVLIQEILFRRDELSIESRMMAGVGRILGGATAHLLPEDLGSSFRPGDSFENLSRTPAKLSAFRDRVLAQPAVAKKRASLAAGEALKFQLFPASPDLETALLARLPAAENQGVQGRLLAACRAEEGLALARADAGWVSGRARLLEALTRRPKSPSAKVAFYLDGLDDIAREDFALQMMAEGTERRAQDPAAVTPPLRLEPVPEYYLALARAIRDLRKDLSEVLGLSAISTLARLEPSGAAAALRVNAEFQRLERLFYGLHMASCDDLGLDPSITDDDMPAPERERARDGARGFCTSPWKDPLLAADSRWAVPLERIDQPAGPRVRAWVSMGVRLVPVELRYRKPPAAQDSQGKPLQRPFGPLYAYLPTRILTTVQVPPEQALTPEGFRQFCAATFKTPNIRFLSRPDANPGSKYGMMLYAGCGLAFLLGVMGFFGAYYLKRSMAD